MGRAETGVGSLATDLGQKIYFSVFEGIGEKVTRRSPVRPGIALAECALATLKRTHPSYLNDSITRVR